MKTPTRQRAQPTPAQQGHFWRRVIKTDECWIWTGQVSVDNRARRRNSGGGYPQFVFRQESVQYMRYGHRLAYELLVGPIPGGMELDHLCRVLRCVRPAHLELVTRQENVARQFALPKRPPPACVQAVLDNLPPIPKRHSSAAPTCINGHDRAQHSRLAPRGKLECTPCRRMYWARWSAKRKQAA